MNTNIKNITQYNNLMRTTIDDKLFFLNKIDENCRVFVDFGCADGSLFNEMVKYLDSTKEYTLIGYDINETMIELAKQNTVGSFGKIHILFTSDWSVVERNLGVNSVLILSSVIHEVYSYAKNNDDIVDFYNKCKQFDYICIRDMMKDHSYDCFETSNEDISKITNYYTNNPKSKYIRQFCILYGSLHNYENFVHFLLKYRYTTNWNREVNENYFPVYLEDLLTTFEENFQILYLKRFKVKFVEDRIKEDFGITLQRPTHVKLVLQKFKTTSHV